MVRIFDGLAERDIRPDEFPLALGVAARGGLLLGEAAETAVSVWLRSHDGRLYVQPEPGGHAARHNGAPVTDPVWLSPGDTLQIGDVRLSFENGEEGPVLAAPAGETTADPEPAAPAPEAGPMATPVSAPAAAPPPRRSGRMTRTHKFVAAGFLILALGIGFVLGASPVTVNVTPQPETMSIDGTIPAIRLGGRYLALPGRYDVRAKLSGYRDLEETVTVDFGASHVFGFDMKLLPGLLTVATRPETPGEIRIDGGEARPLPAKNIELDPGTHTVSVTSARYFPAERTVEITGKGISQTLEFDLKPAWGTLRLTSLPAGAEVRLNGRPVGVTPLTAEPVQGTYRMEVSRPGWKTAVREVAITAGQVSAPGPVALERVDGTLDLSTRPSGAIVSIDGAFRGRTPLSVPLVSDKTYAVRLTKPGYENRDLSVPIRPEETSTVDAELTPEYGVVFVSTRPSGAELKVDGEPRGPASQRLRLMTRAHRIVVSKPGFVDFETTVTPRRGVSKRLDVTLERRIDALKKRAEGSVETKSGHKVRIVPVDGAVRFTVGASRREAGRRANEALYLVELTKSFMIGETEVTNEEFRRFAPTHNSGPGLNGARQPAVSVSWDDAARYLNWLSDREGLPRAYRADGERMAVVLPLTAGYRLPTEAEWVFAARYEAGRRPLSRPLKFPWGQTMPPAARSGNYADGSAAGQVPVVIPGYSDGYRYTAPAGSFPANAHGLRDLGGNAAEWCNDFYDAFIGRGQAAVRDPVGPASGRFRIVRGSSWRHGTITELRFSFRDYSEKPRNDIGFRIARYVQTPP